LHHVSNLLNIPLQPPPRLTLGEHVAESLRDAIFGGHFRPDQRLSEAQIAGSLRVSRAPVRDALAQLELEGLVVRINNNRGIAVRLLSHQDMDEICSLRYALESLGLRRAIQHATEEHLDHMASVIEETKQVTSAGQLALLDLKFHEAIVRAANHERLLASWLNLRSQIRLLLVQRNLDDTGTVQGTLRSHLALLDVIRKRDEKRALTMLGHHLHDHYTWFQETFPEAEQPA
jgi:DNA-binding GntR family transcriptional regulator